MTRPDLSVGQASTFVLALWFLDGAATTLRRTKPHVIGNTQCRASHRWDCEDSVIVLPMRLALIQALAFYRLFRMILIGLIQACARDLTGRGMPLSSHALHVCV